MTSLAALSPVRPQRPGRAPLLTGLAGLVVLVGIGVASPPLALHGWLIGFAFASNIGLGAVALLLVHALTGGRWGDVHRAAFLSLARTTPALIVLVLPLLFGARAAYPWAAEPSTAGPDIPQFYLNPLAVGLRSLVGLALMSLLAWRLDRGRPGRLEAGFGLCAYAVFVNASAYDWLLSLAPRFTSSAFGVQIIVGQLLAALGVTVLLSRAPRDDRSWGDLGGLMLATTLGLGYLVLMGLAINWYGDLPVQAAWYMSRTEHGWVSLELAGAVIGGALPVLLLLFGAVRNRPGSLRIVALCALAGLLIEAVWLVAPVTEPWSAVVGLVAVAAVLAILVAAGQALGGLRGVRHVD